MSVRDGKLGACPYHGDLAILGGVREWFWVEEGCIWCLQKAVEVLRDCFRSGTSESECLRCETY